MSRQGEGQDDLIRLALIGVSLSLMYLTVAVPSGFLKHARYYASDLYAQWKQSLWGAPGAAKEMLLITVDDESQRHLKERWPWNRILFAQALERLSPHLPKLVLLDFAFVGTSDPKSDEALVHAIRQAPPTLLASYLDPQGELMAPLPLFTEAGGITGLINKPLDSDSSVRRIWSVILYPGQPGPLFGIEVKTAALAWGVPSSEIKKSDRLLQIGTHRVPINFLGTTRINYLAAAQDLQTIPFWKILAGEFEDSAVRGKIILIGSSREITHDVHATSLGRMSGVLISANGILTLLSERYLKEIPQWLSVALGLLLVVGVALWTYRVSLPTGLLTAASVGGLAFLGGFLLACMDFWTEGLSPILLAAGAWLTGFFYKHLVLLLGTLRLQRQAVTDPVTGALTHRYFRLQLKQELQRAQRNRKPVTLVVACGASPSQELQSQSWEEVRRRMRVLVATVQEGLPGKGMVGRLREGEFGVALAATPLAQAQAMVRAWMEQLASKQEEVKFGIASSEQSASLFNAELLIQAADRAVERARARGALGYEVFDPAVESASLKPVAEEGAAQEPPGHLEEVASELDERNLALEKALKELREAHQQLEAAFLEVTKSLVLALETKDAYTAGHLERVSRYASRLAQELHLPKAEVEAIREAALLHDIGKIGLPDEVLHKMGPLNDEEREILRQHLSIGAKILEPMKFFRSITTLIYHHHEWYNGKGYPHGLAGDFIPPGAQVIAIADAFDAMTTQRSYNKPMTVQEALTEMRRGSGTQFNPQYVEKFSEVISREGPQLAGYVAA